MKRNEKIIFYFENSCKKTLPSHDYFVKKVRKFLNKKKPQKMWEERGVFNKKTGKNIFPDFAILLKNKLIACEAEKLNLKRRYEAYNGFNFFDEIWFFTNIEVDQLYFYYKFENNLTVKQRFFGVNEKGEIVEIKIPTESTVRGYIPRIYDEFFS